MNWNPVIFIMMLLVFWGIVGVWYLMIHLPDPHINLRGVMIHKGFMLYTSKILTTIKCEVCDTDNAIQKHHVTPVSKGGAKGLEVACCVDCGNQIHMLYTNKELAIFGSLEILIHQEDMKKYIEWKRKHPGGHRYTL